MFRDFHLQKQHKISTKHNLYIRPFDAFNQIGATVQYRVVITPPVLKVRVNNPIEFECYVMEDTGRQADVLPTFSMSDARIRFDQERVAANRVRFVIRSGLTQQYNGTEVRCSVEVSLPGNCF